MAIVKPAKSRAIIEHTAAGLRITVPARARVFATAFEIILMPLWIFGGIASIYAITKTISFGDTAYIAFWLAIWTLAGLWSLSVLLWNLAGKEIIDLDATTLKRRKQIPFFSRSKDYAVTDISSLRLAPPRVFRHYFRQDMSFLIFNDSGAIAFDYGRDTHRLGTGLTQAEADHVIKEMRRSVKTLRTFDTTLPGES